MTIDRTISLTAADDGGVTVDELRRFVARLDTDGMPGAAPVRADSRRGRLRGLTVTSEVDVPAAAPEPVPAADEGLSAVGGSTARPETLGT